MKAHVYSLPRARGRIFELWVRNVSGLSIADTGSCFPLLDFGSVPQGLKHMC